MKTTGTKRRWILRRALPAALFFAVSLFVSFPIGRYLIRAAWEEGRILAGRRPIVDMLADPGTDNATRSSLRLVLDARDFAADSVGLKVKESFTTFSQLDGDTLVLLLSGARKDLLQPHTWWFPIVGRVPYKGFFDYAAAHREAASLEARGHDVSLRPVSAFSTLGWFNDPLLSTTLRADSLELANTVIHEVTHNTFYAPGQAVFNESFANFVGSRGAAWFFRSRGEEHAARLVEARWDDDRTLGGFWSRLYSTLDSAFSAHPDDRDARLAARELVYAAARDSLRALVPALRTFPPEYAERVRLDNAALLARRIYMTDLSVFDAVWELEGRDLRATIARVIQLARSEPDDPFAALRRHAGESGTPPEVPPVLERVPPPSPPPAQASQPPVSAAPEPPLQERSQVESGGNG